MAERQVMGHLQAVLAAFQAAGMGLPSRIVLSTDQDWDVLFSEISVLRRIGRPLGDRRQNMTSLYVFGETGMVEITCPMIEQIAEAEVEARGREAAYRGLSALRCSAEEAPDG